MNRKARSPVYPAKNASVLLAQEVAVAVTKTEVISVRVPPDIKSALTAAAAAERRSLASMVETMVLDYCRVHGIHPNGGPAQRTARRASR